MTESDNYLESPESKTISIDSETLVDLVSSKAAELAASKISHQEDRRRQNFLVVLSIVSLLGAGAVFSGISLLIKSEVQSELDSSTTKDKLRLAAQEAIDEQVGQLKSEIEGIVSYQQLSALSLSLELSGGFSASERDQAISVLKNIRRTEIYKNREDFIVHLEKIVDTFTSASQGAAIDQIDDLYREELTASGQASLILVNHYGRGLLISVTENDRRRSSERFEVYSTAMQGKDFPEVGLLYKLLYSYKNEAGIRSKPETTNLIQALNFLDDADKDNYSGLMATYCDAESWQSTVNAEGREIESLCTGFITEYEDILLELGITL